VREKRRGKKRRGQEGEERRNKRGLWGRDDSY
jgi:hypothetical protein